MNDDICDLTAQELHELYKTAEISPVEVMKAVLLRTEQLDPAVNAFCQISPDALDVARASERRWQSRRSLGPLDGVPVSVKDNVAVAGLTTRYGSRVTDETPSHDDSPCVARLRESGAICFAKTTLPDFAHKIVTDSPLTGVTRNPWDTGRTPGGSSGGAAAAVSLGMAPVAIGTDGGGSIRIPAAFTGTFGFKPSFGRVPHAPRGPFGLLSHVGPITRCVADAARVLTVISRPDSRDWYALPFDGSDYELGLKCKPTPGGVRIAYSPSLGLAVTPETAVHDAVMRAADTFRELGAKVCPEDPPGVARCNSIHATLWPACCRQLTEDMADGGAGLDPSLQAYSDAGAAISRHALLGALIERGELGAAVNAFFERYDLVICPVYPRVAMPLAELRASDELFPHFTAWCNQLGLPAASVYAGTTANGLPVGIQIVGGRYADALVLWASHILELSFGRAPLTDVARSLSTSVPGRATH
ncbi:amidase family protein [Paraburkholderia silvatlantica]|uniref:Aspartyl-tRNA(Asn)/glutamyl-tRNA(Gln) amidotransferase subunit A n=1 Tax=Paraburkholderia silvatlantica TaxID=321895 RepID=A0ABR6FT56_9BURK|nr:amidase family protein [Paraburkholderia silvatlantica]MBB2930592.1 aspartyl-tRNA(Asn)/glutamyl-tRNA(Gln) amidotransferase subunit A [Paraburkholderia silvatlantica]PVY30394.1 aspartyl-tRNA(Asn)/glutamyl-tRNA(Gln) amidotransferase subunit A [Paraburkholderia silvatlantica]PXW36869.1 aspartyl-tRNA(Asn)/glutamyl-tRNA(Gln) amidotransferase subunit A [Paraburkholderia silvatlantica]